MTTRKLAALLGLIFIFAVLVAPGCDLINGPGTVINQTVVQNPNGSGGSATPSPSPAPGCLPIDHIRVTLKGEGGRSTVPINSDETLDATPIDSSGKQADFACHGHMVTWETKGSALCTVYGEGFNPPLRCTTPGDIEIKATVSSPGSSGTLKLQVVL